MVWLWAHAAFGIITFWPLGTTSTGSTMGFSAYRVYDRIGIGAYGDPSGSSEVLRVYVPIRAIMNLIECDQTLLMMARNGTSAEQCVVFCSALGRQGAVPSNRPTQCDHWPEVATGFPAFLVRGLVGAMHLTGLARAAPDPECMYIPRFRNSPVFHGHGTTGVGYGVLSYRQHKGRGAKDPSRYSLGH